MWLRVYSWPYQVCTGHLLFSGLLHSIISVVTRVYCERERKEVIILKPGMGQEFPVEAGLWEWSPEK